MPATQGFNPLAALHVRPGPGPVELPRAEGGLTRFGDAYTYCPDLSRRQVILEGWQVACGVVQ